jgi:hypothetical protein
MVNAIEAVKAKVQIAWFKACAVEEIDPKSSFVIFSEENQAAKEYNELMGEFLKLQRSTLV